MASNEEEINKIFKEIEEELEKICENNSTNQNNESVIDKLNRFKSENEILFARVQELLRNLAALIELNNNLNLRNHDIEHKYQQILDDYCKILNS